MSDDAKKFKTLAPGTKLPDVPAAALTSVLTDSDGNVHLVFHNGGGKPMAKASFNFEEAFSLSNTIVDALDEVHDECIAPAEAAKATNASGLVQ